MPGRQARHEAVPGTYATFLSKAGKPLRDAACCAYIQKNGAVIHNFCGQGQRKARLAETERDGSLLAIEVMAALLIL